MRGRTVVARQSSLTFQFDNPDAMDHFWRWLCESGEQLYWDYMSEREADEDGDITVLRFDYGKARKGLVTTKCGRFTGEAALMDDGDGEI
jgi:hypothetical protein